MIENLPTTKKHDRLAAFVSAYGLRAQRCDNGDGANLLIIDADGADAPTHLIYRPQSISGLPARATVLAAAIVDFGQKLNPLVGALPPELVFDLQLEPQLLALSHVILSESNDPRCGGGTIHARLSEVVVVLAIRRALAMGTVNAGLLAGLAHSEIHASLVAMHDAPARSWRIEDLAAIAGMKRGRFIEVFGTTVGRSPVAYLVDWRLSLGRVQLHAGESVKVVAAATGFGSPEAFSRAFSRKYGYPPSREFRKERLP